MKRFLLIIAACFPAIGLLAADVEPMSTDTVIRLENKRIVVKDNGERMKVKVYELAEEGDSIDSEMIFEGHYRDGQSYERRKHIKSINIPIPSWDKDFDPHWAGFGMGFANLSGSEGVNDVDGVSLRSGSSLEYNLNFMEFSFPFSRHRWAVVTGAGMRWSRYRLDMNAHFQEVDGVTQLIPAPDGIVYNASKLNITSLTIPVLLEWQSPKHRRKSPRFFVSGGVVGVIKTISSSKIVYHDADGEKRKKKMDRGMNLRPVTMDFLFQAGVGCIGFYAKYSPFGLFEKDKAGIATAYMKRKTWRVRIQQFRLPACSISILTNKTQIIMAGIMNTLWDESSELEDEILTPRPVLSDDYTTHDVTKLDETIEDADENDKIIEESLKTSQDK